MKKYLLSAALLITVSISAKAQFSLGIKGGVNFSKINADNFNESSITGYQAGVFARIGSAFYLQPEVYLSSSGGDFDSNQNGTDYNAHVKFTNLNVPLLLGHRFGPKNLNFRLMVGPVYNYILNKNESFSDNFESAFHDFGNYNNSTLGFQAGGGVDIGFVTADLRYQGGLSQINSNFGQTQHLWALSVGFKFF
ncbi:MAG TPA: porin family protein [Mucilaginibacter sp.]|nr:porin family protein [Mucilaginibacter sp.]